MNIFYKSRIKCYCSLDPNRACHYLSDPAVLRLHRRQQALDRDAAFGDLDLIQTERHAPQSAAIVPEFDTVDIGNGGLLPLEQTPNQQADKETRRIDDRNNDRDGDEGTRRHARVEDDDESEMELLPVERRADPCVECEQP
jgi:hypothetical protein